MINTVGVVGAGTMGNGIAQVFALAGFTVRVHDVVPGALDRARTTIERSLGKFVEKGKLQAADRDAALGRLTMSTDLDTLGVIRRYREREDGKLPFGIYADVEEPGRIRLGDPVEVDRA